jgi:hypothetical protein
MYCKEGWKVWQSPFRAVQAVRVASATFLAVQGIVIVI